MKWIDFEVEDGRAELDGLSRAAESLAEFVVFSELQAKGLPTANGCEVSPTKRGACPQGKAESGKSTNESQARPEGLHYGQGIQPLGKGLHADKAVADGNRVSLAQFATEMRDELWCDQGFGIDNGPALVLGLWLHLEEFADLWIGVFSRGADHDGHTAVARGKLLTDAEFGRMSLDAEDDLIVSTDGLKEGGEFSLDFPNSTLERAEPGNGSAVRSL